MKDSLPSTGWLEFTTRSRFFPKSGEVKWKFLLNLLKNWTILNMLKSPAMLSVGKLKEGYRRWFPKVIMNGDPQVKSSMFVFWRFCISSSSSYRLQALPGKFFVIQRLQHTNCKGSLTYQITIWGDQLAVLLRIICPGFIAILETPTDPSVESWNGLVVTLCALALV